jgi:hypothetical protein
LRIWPLQTGLLTARLGQPRGRRNSRRRAGLLRLARARRRSRRLCSRMLLSLPVWLTLAQRCAGLLRLARLPRRAGSLRRPRPIELTWLLLPSLSLPRPILRTRLLRPGPVLQIILPRLPVLPRQAGLP